MPDFALSPWLGDRPTAQHYIISKYSNLAHGLCSARCLSPFSCACVAFPLKNFEIIDYVAGAFKAAQAFLHFSTCSFRFLFNDSTKAPTEILCMQ